MSDTCGTCKHAFPVDPNGHWRHREERENYPETHVHCRVANIAYFGEAWSEIRGHVIRKDKACTFQPSEWEGK